MNDQSGRLGSRTRVGRSSRVTAAILLLLTVVAAQEALLRFFFPLPELKGFNRIQYMPLGPAGKTDEAVRSIRMVVESSPDHVRVAEAAERVRLSRRPMAHAQGGRHAQSGLHRR